MKGFFQRRLIQPIVAVLKQGLTPEKIALCLAMGIVIGVFPAIGWTTLLCTLAAFAFRLNLPAIQLANWLMAPAQIALLLPFIRLGELLFRAPRLPMNATQILTLISSDLGNAIRVLWTATWQAVVAWMVIAPFAVLLLYFALKFPVRSLARAYDLVAHRHPHAKVQP